MIVDFLILGGFSSQIKLKIIELISLISCSGITSTDVLKITFERPNVLTMFILPRSVRFLLCQLFKVFSRFLIFSVKFNSVTLLESYEKKIPTAFIGSRGQWKPNRVSRLFFQLPSHIPSVFVALISKPERFLK